MPLPLIPLEQFVELLPDEPEFAPDHPNWFPLEIVRVSCVALSESGMQKARKRLGNRWEHRHKGKIYLYSPYWIRGYFIDRNWSERKR